MAHSGLFIVFEAASKCGKTTLATLLSKKLSQNHEVVSKRGALSTSAFGQQISKLDIRDIAYSSAFYWADTVFDTQDTILPALRAGKTVIQDRYDLSIVAFRDIHDMHHDIVLVEEYLQRGMLINPDVTIFLNPDQETAFRRISTSEDSTFIDRIFLKKPELFEQMQTNIRENLQRLKRRHIVLNTSEMDTDECIHAICSTISA